MKYYKILKNDVLIGTGKSGSGVPVDNNQFTFIEISQEEYRKLKL